MRGEVELAFHQFGSRLLVQSIIEVKPEDNEFGNGSPASLKLSKGEAH